MIHKNKYKIFIKYYLDLLTNMSNDFMSELAAELADAQARVTDAQARLTDAQAAFDAAQNALTEAIDEMNIAKEAYQLSQRSSMPALTAEMRNLLIRRVDIARVAFETSRNMELTLRHAKDRLDFCREHLADVEERAPQGQV